MRVAVIIPARMGSSRFPGKPLAKIRGKSLIQRVVENALTAERCDEVVLATCDEEISAEVSSIDGLTTVRTGSHHVRATDRTLEAAILLENSGRRPDLIVMLQGDEPCITGPMLDDQIRLHLEDQSVTVSNLVGKIRSREEHHSPNSIKVALNESLEIVYLSRLPIPGDGHLDSPYLVKQVCSIAFTWERLVTFGKLGESPLESAESIDMLRFVENRIPIKAVLTPERTHPVDVKSDIAVVERILDGIDEPGL